jgi:hypothetical protein
MSKVEYQKHGVRDPQFSTSKVEDPERWAFGPQLSVLKLKTQTIGLSILNFWCRKLKPKSSL